MITENLFKKKGTYLILNLLKYKGLYYNSIKKEVEKYFSARTLDFRLKELLNFGIIDVEIKRDIIPNRKKYCLTDKGIISLTSFQVMEQLMNNQITPDEFLNKFSVQLLKNEKINFNKIWRELKNILKEKKILLTLKKKKPNRIKKIDDTGIIVKTEKGEDEISIKTLEEAWENFVKDGYLQQNEHFKASYRSSFILTLFSQLPFVKVDNGPPISIRLELTN